MFSIADMAVAGAVALLLFGPDQLPKVARRAGQLVRDVQNTSQSFIREMERAADAHDLPPDSADPYAGPGSPVTVPAPLPAAAPEYHAAPVPAPHELVAREAALGPHPLTTDVPVPETSTARDAARVHDEPPTGSHAGEPAP